MKFSKSQNLTAEQTASSRMLLSKQIIPGSTRPSLLPFMKILYKWNKHFNLNFEKNNKLKVLRENSGSILHDIGVGKDFPNWIKFVSYEAKNVLL